MPDTGVGTVKEVSQTISFNKNMWSRFKITERQLCDDNLSVHFFVTFTFNFLIMTMMSKETELSDSDYGDME